ncbi:hypothetical protein HPB47_012194 [Ixodes persulcatus]|uniref:Uncharacterized protein n=1 Tax=Ixodes persulcatus TaxID=34615 RepID=A0AC60NUC2_IXOPE|nr:hypothetical protein HPB47_012194 [Ixodes persulcatus]
MDSWTSHNSYVCITGHMMDTTFVQHARVLACTMPDSHATKNLALFIASVIEEWELPSQNALIYVVTVNGRNFTSAVARSAWIGAQCFGHTL